MASNFESSIHRGSDFFFDFSCFTCQGNDRNTEAEFFCDDCSKVYCGKCLEYHNFLFQKHATFGKKNISKWPVANATFDVLEQCQVHKDRKLEIFCEDHSELMCTVCDMYNHRKCSHVVLIADKVKDLHQKGEFKQLSATLDTLHGQLILKKDDFEESLKSLEKSYNTILEEIKALRKSLTDYLDQLERNTIKELDTLLARLRTSIQTDHGNCIGSVKKMTSIKEDWLNVKGKSEAIQMNMYRKCLDLSVKTQAVLQKMAVKNDITLSFTPDPIIEQTMPTISGLGQILIKEVTRETKPEACCTLSSKHDPKNQTIDTEKPSLVSRTLSGTARKADIANQTSTLNKPVRVSKQMLVTPKQGNIANQTKVVTMQDIVSNPISSSSTQSNITRDTYMSGKMSDAITRSLHKLVDGYKSSAIDKTDPNQLIRVKRSKKHNVKIKREINECTISGICETDNGELIITDWKNWKVKLLDQTYKVVAHYDLPPIPWSMCRIDSSLVAVAVCDQTVFFIKVTNGQLVKDRILIFEHDCFGIAHHQGNLYISSDKALYHYTVDGRLVSKMYEDTSGELTVATCAVSPDGDRIYVFNQASNQLVTLSREGAVISTLKDPVLRGQYDGLPFGLHVTNSGQVLVCGFFSNTILHIDRDGRKRLAEMVTDGVENPTSVYYSTHTGTLVVGMLFNNNIMVFSTR